MVRLHWMVVCIRIVAATLISSVLISCGGGSGSSSILSGAAPPAYVSGTYAASSNFAGHCAAPRSGIDPSTNQAYVDVSGSVAWENDWLRSWSHELYLWYRELPDLNPASISTTQNYFDALKTSALTPSGKAKDRFHFIYPTTDWLALSQSGVSAGYGMELVVTANAPPRSVLVAYTDPGFAAAAANITRGARILKVDGVDIVNDNTLTAWPEGLFPDAANETHTFVIDANGAQRTVSLTSVKVTSTPVQNVTTIASSTGTVGYMLFNDHIATAEQQLINAFTQLKNANVTDLVLDIRYNGGGYLAIASEVAYMIAGSATSGKNFEQLTFNDQYTTIDPVTKSAIMPTPFYSTALGFSAASGTALPTLNLRKVYVITGANTCSASESIINGLTGIGVQVIQIGSTTCGKPYGFYPQDNCGTTYFTIEFKGVNNIGFGDYSDGFSPGNTPSGNAGVTLSGCSVADDFTHNLGNQLEGRLAAALFYRANQTCSSGATGVSQGAQIQAATEGEANNEGYMLKNPLRENRIITR